MARSLYAAQNAAEPINRIPPTALMALPHVLQHKSLSLLQELALAADYNAIVLLTQKFGNVSSTAFTS
ncbi:hypothetical protein PN498_01970 [Oscillatoria sp. CS-180]|uniref:hypothetical protein n=1 Tax=Oscillatoria sp. CS-180 TaxID=3021720 RepID=UPI00232D1C8A|nr:hypothetical protein [Oscillatoria sp. CS-180]MDB9524743.1 hypothetical protein [Oscillatoria sp. CS-180]